ncbi:hypothetical protein H311_02088 [Anncaliia algerae PRA109]|nr:hypothetical protein H311_02088 [Anncaliia algerae PRA109]
MGSVLFFKQKLYVKHSIALFISSLLRLCKYIHSVTQSYIFSKAKLYIPLCKNIYPLNKVTPIFIKNYIFIYSKTKYGEIKYIYVHELKGPKAKKFNIYKKHFLLIFPYPTILSCEL